MPHVKGIIGGSGVVEDAKDDPDDHAARDDDIRQRQQPGQTVETEQTRRAIPKRDADLGDIRSGDEDQRDEREEEKGDLGSDDASEEVSLPRLAGGAPGEPVMKAERDRHQQEGDARQPRTRRLATTLRAPLDDADDDCAEPDSRGRPRVES